MTHLKKILVDIKRRIYSFIPLKFLLKNFGFVAMGERYRPNPFFLTIDAVQSDFNCIFRADTKLPFTNESIKILYSSHNLEHFQEQVASNYFREAHRVLMHGGELLIEVPDCKLYYEAYTNYAKNLDKEKLLNLTNFSFCEQVIENIKKNQPEGDLNLLNDVRTKFALAVSCYCEPPFLGPHTPVLHAVDNFDEAFRSMSMDNFFSWLISAQSQEQISSGGHCSAWYPEKLIKSLESEGFSASIRDYKCSRKIPSWLVPDRKHRTFGSFRISAIKK